MSISPRSSQSFRDFCHQEFEKALLERVSENEGDDSDDDSDGELDKRCRQEFLHHHSADGGLTSTVKVDTNGDILLCASSREFLTEKAKLLGEYTKKVDPAALNDKKIVVAKMEFKYKGFEYSTLLGNIYGGGKEPERTSLLPRVVQRLYSVHPINNSYGDSHQTAIVTAGLFPGMLGHGSQEMPVGSSDRVIKGALQPGDHVRLIGKNQSIVWLDGDICLSMNGRSSPLELQSVQRVFDIFHFNGEGFKSKNPEITNEIYVLRKKEEWKYTEEILEAFDLCYLSARLRDENGYKMFGNLSHITNEKERIAAKRKLNIVTGENCQNRGKVITRLEGLIIDLGKKVNEMESSPASKASGEYEKLKFSVEYLRGKFKTIERNFARGW